MAVSRGMRSVGSFALGGVALPGIPINGSTPVIVAKGTKWIVTFASVVSLTAAGAAAPSICELFDGTNVVCALGAGAVANDSKSLGAGGSAIGFVDATAGAITLTARNSLDAAAGAVTLGGIFILEQQY